MSLTFYRLFLMNWACLSEMRSPYSTFVSPDPASQALDIKECQVYILCAFNYIYYSKSVYKWIKLIDL